MIIDAEAIKQFPAFVALLKEQGIDIDQLKDLESLQSDMIASFSWEPLKRLVVSMEVVAHLKDGRRVPLELSQGQMIEVFQPKGKE